MNPHIIDQIYGAAFDRIFEFAESLEEDKPKREELAPVEIGRLVGLSGCKVNQALKNLGYQHCVRGDDGRLHWALTKKGTKIAFYHNKLRGQIFWKPEIVGILKEYLS